MVLNDLRHNVESHSQAGDRLLLGTSDPIEPLKNLVALFSWDAQAMIAHTDRDRLWGGVEVNLDGLGVRGILDGITDQVGEDLFEPTFISDE